MYFTSRLEIDPSQITLIKKVKPIKVFAKFLHNLTLGQLSDKMEHETFTAVAILQQLNMGLRSIEVKNMIRLAVDNYDFYLDEKGVEDDLDTAMFEFKSKVDPLESELFDSIYLVLEHIEDSIKYLIEMRVIRKHKVGEYPIVVTINGVLSDFIFEESSGKKGVVAKISKEFKTQEDYERCVSDKRMKFNKFVSKLEDSIQKFIKVDHIIRKTNVRVVRPSEEVNKPEDIKNDRYGPPAYYGYYNFDRYFLYTFFWAKALYDHNIYCHNFFIVDELGHDVLLIGDGRFNARDFNTLNTEQPFEPPRINDVTFFYDNEYSDSLTESSFAGFESTRAKSSTPTEKDSDANVSCSGCSSCGGCGD